MPFLIACLFSLLENSEIQVPAGAKVHFHTTKSFWRSHSYLRYIYAFPMSM